MVSVRSLKGRRAGGYEVAADLGGLQCYDRK